MSTRQKIAQGKGSKVGRKDTKVITVTATDVNEEKEPLRKIRNLNLMASLLHLTISLIVALVGNRKLDLQFFVMNLETLNRQEGDWIVYPKTNSRVLQLNLIATIATFEALTALFHIGNAFIWRSFYEKNLDKCMCPTRWLEYSITAPIMIHLLAIFSGFVNFYVHVLFFGLTHVTMFFGYLTEIIARPSFDNGRYETSVGSKYTAHFLGYIPQLFVWIPLVVQFIRYSQAEGLDEDGAVLNKMPEWVYVIFVIEIFLFWSFAFIQLRVLSRPPSYYLTGEYWYVILSFVSKASLSFIVFGGTLNLAVGNV